MLKDWNGLEEVTEVTEGIGMGGGDWKKFSHARASGARRISVSVLGDRMMHTNMYKLCNLNATQDRELYFL